MKFRFVPNPSISSNLNETVRFPTVGLLDADYLLKDEKDRDVGKARVTDGIIKLFAVNSELEPFYRDKVKDLLLRAIVTDADSMNANLSIDLQPDGFDPRDMVRFFEQFGFRRVTDTIMKRNAGAAHPVSMAEGEVVPFRHSKPNAGLAGWAPTPNQFATVSAVADHLINPETGTVGIEEYLDYIEQNRIAELVRLSYPQLFKLYKYGQAKQWRNMSPGGFREWDQDSSLITPLETPGQMA